MPANPEYLTKNPLQRFAKVSAATVGSLLVTAASMLAIAVWFDNPKLVFLTYAYAFPLLWCALMLVAFLFKNGWRCWALYGGIALVCAVVFLTGYLQNPTR